MANVAASFSADLDRAALVLPVTGNGLWLTLNHTRLIAVREAHARESRPAPVQSIARA